MKIKQYIADMMWLDAWASMTAMEVTCQSGTTSTCTSLISTLCNYQTWLWEPGEFQVSPWYDDRTRKYHPYQSDKPCRPHQWGRWAAWVANCAALWTIYYTWARAKAEDNTYKSPDTYGQGSKATDKPQVASYTTVPICKKMELSRQL